MWTSPDAREWTRSPYDPDVWGLPGFQPYPFLALGGPGLVAWAADDWGAAIWDSPDGVTWKRVPYDQLVFGPGTRIGAMAEGGPGLVAIGEDGGKAVVWTATYG